MSLVKLGLLLLIGVVVGAVGVNLVTSQHQDGGQEVRVSALPLADGRIAVAVQERDGAGWGDRQFPVRRIIPANPLAGRWLNSSAVTLAVPEPGVVEAGEPRRICLVTHEQPGDHEFWNLARNAAAVITRETGVVVDYHAEPAPGGQAARVRQCVDEGVQGIVLTLPNLDDDLEQAINYAHDNFVVISTFNSGARDFRKINSNVHVSINEFDAGRNLGVRLTDLGVSGNALCVVHEEENVALQERCDGLAEGYQGGTIDHLSVSEFGVRDLPNVQAAIVERLRDESAPVGVVVALNHNVTLAAVEAAKELEGESQVQIAGFDYTVPVLEAIERGEVLLAVQQYLLRQSMSAMFVTITRFGLTDRMAAVGVNVRELIRPVLLTVEAQFVDQSNVGETINLFRALPRLSQRSEQESEDDDG